MAYTKIKRWFSASNALLNAVAATGAGSTKTVPGDTIVKTFRYWVLASAVTTGGTVTFQASHDGTNWASLGTQAVSANGLTTGTFSGPFKYYRANLTARTDGTYSVFGEVTYEP
jgi:hypothetical protein